MNASGGRPAEDAPVRPEDVEVTLSVRRDLGPGGEDAAIHGDPDVALSYRGGGATGAG